MAYAETLHTLGLAFMVIGAATAIVSMVWPLVWPKLRDLGEDLGWL